MREHRAKIVIVMLMLLVVGVPFMLRPAAVPREGAAGTGDAPRLVIFSPHNEQVRHELAWAFNAWRAGRGEAAVQFDWRASGGTSDLRKGILAQFEAAARAGTEDQGIGADLFFGGGEFEHNKLVQGVTVMRGGEPVTVTASISMELSEALLTEAFPSPYIGGERLYHPERYWVGVVLASFGIVYNRDVLMMVNLLEPETWADMADPAYTGWIALADPGHSGSIAVTYDTIVRRLGWTDGWALLRRIFANARYFTASASKVPVDVSAGEAAAGMCIDFYGRFQAGAVSTVAGAADRVGYVDPDGMTATTADPISILRGAPQRALANQFVTWLLSADAQRLWQRKLGSPGGPVRYELRRQPVRRDLYTAEEKIHWTDPEIDPFNTAKPYTAQMPSYYNMIAPVSHAMAIDVHDELRAAWRAILRTSADHPHRNEMLALFDQMPVELTLDPADDMEAFRARLNERYRDPDRMLTDRIAWTLFFRNNYQRIVELAERP